MQCKVGLATAETDLSYLYHIKDQKEAKLQPELAFQAQISYCKADGSELLRVISVKLPTTASRSEANSTCDVSLVYIFFLQLHSL